MPRSLKVSAPIVRRGILRGIEVPKAEAATAAGIPAGKKAPARLPVVVRLGRDAFESTLLPRSPEAYLLVVPMVYLRERGLDAGDSLTAQIEPDTGRGPPELAPDIEAGLRADPQVWDDFQNSTVAHQRELVRYIEAAARPRTRANRIEQAAAIMRDYLSRKKGSS